MDESDILKLGDSLLDNDKQWQGFRLKHVEVYDEDGTTYRSLLDANAETPLVVRGRLVQVDSEQEHLILSQRYLGRQPVELTSIRQFSFAAREDGSMALRAGGKTIWFELLTPTRRYRAIFDSMVEATRLWLFLVDRHADVSSQPRSRKPEKRMGPPSLDQLLEACTANRDLSCTTVKEAKLLLQLHRRFLIASMRADASTVKWSKTPLWTYLLSIKKPALGKRRNGSVSVAATTSQRRVNSQSSTSSSDSSSAKSHTRTHSTESEASPSRNNKRTRSVGLSDDSDDSPRPHKALHAAQGTLRLKEQVGLKAALRSQPRQVDGSQESEDEERTSSSTSEDDSPVSKNLSFHPSFPQQRKSSIVFPPPQESSSEDEAPPARSPSSPVPFYEPTGPGENAWTCIVDECSFRVDDARSPNGQLRIRKHIQEHATALEDSIGGVNGDEDPKTEKLRLVLQESRLLLPVSNLVDRIREMTKTTPSTAQAG